MRFLRVAPRGTARSSADFYRTKYQRRK